MSNVLKSKSVYVTVQEECRYVYVHLNLHIFTTHKYLRLSTFSTSPFKIPCTCSWSKQSREKLIVCQRAVFWALDIHSVFLGMLNVQPCLGYCSIEIHREWGLMRESHTPTPHECYYYYYSIAALI